VSEHTSDTRSETANERQARQLQAEARQPSADLAPARQLLPLQRGRGGGLQRSTARQTLRLQASRGNQYVQRLMQRASGAGEGSRDRSAGTSQRSRAETAVSVTPASAQLQRDGGGTTVTMNLGEVQHGHYNVTGANFQACVNQMNARGEWGLGGIRNIHMSSGSVGEDGIVSSVTITGEYFTSLPRWTHLSSKPERVQDEWNRMLAALTGHENHHVSIAQEHMNALPDTLSNIHEDDLHQVWGDAISALRQAQIDYDSETTNGQTEGVTLDAAVEDEPEGEAAS
jgi:hypothetical protein